MKSEIPFDCKYYNCGMCYAPEEAYTTQFTKPNDVGGECNNPKWCNHRWLLTSKAIKGLKNLDLHTGNYTTLYEEDKENERL